MKNKKIKMLLIAIVLCISCFLTCFSTTINVAYADSVGVDYGYSNVLDDLKQDENFSTEKYLVDMQDYSLKVIQIAESIDNELFVYVYQPCSPNADLKATSINISIVADINNPSPKNYKLLLLNSEGVFYKYKVKDFVVSDESIRYYDIISIFRAWSSKYDDELSKDNDNNINYVSFNVGERFTARYDENGYLCYSHSGIEVIEIIEKYTSFIRYTNGTVYNMEDRHFTAFSCDRPIDKLIEADIQFVHYTVHKEVDYMADGGSQIISLSSENDYGVAPLSTTEYTYGERITENKTLKNDNVVSVKVGLIFTQKYSWTEIQSVSEFVKQKDHILSDTTKANLLSKDWVLNFYVSSYDEGQRLLMLSPIGEYEDKTVVENVTILRLKYETDGVVYNLGCVDNMSSGSGEVGGTNITLFEKIEMWLKSALLIIMLILLIVVLSPFLPTLFNIIWGIIKIVIKLALWIITAPFKLLSKLFKKRE